MVFGKTDKSMEKEKLVSGSGKTKVILLVVKDIDMYTSSTVGQVLQRLRPIKGGFTCGTCLKLSTVG